MVPEGEFDGTVPNKFRLASWIQEVDGISDVITAATPGPRRYCCRDKLKSCPGTTDRATSGTAELLAELLARLLIVRDGPIPEEAGTVAGGLIIDELDPAAESTVISTMTDWL